MREHKADISFVIVTWNSEKEIRNCILSAIGSSAGLQTEVIVVDNASKDKTTDAVEELQEQYSFIELIVNKENLGYTKACNIGMEAADGEYVYLLNPDTVCFKESSKILHDYLLQNKNAAAAAPQLLNDDGTIQHSVRNLPKYSSMFFEMLGLSKAFPENKVFNNWKMTYFRHNERIEAEQPMAAALMVRESALRRVSFMDERFYMFFNDVDLCRKLLLDGKKIIFYPKAKVQHSKGVSIYKDRALMIKVWTEDCLKYFKKHHDNVIFYPLLAAGLKAAQFVRLTMLKIKK